jgi:rSAM/selenodomain-associated transferase 1
MACDPSRSLPFFKALSIVHRLKLINQQGRTLGLRMRNAAHTVWKPGMRGVILLGTDSPTLPKAHLEEAAAMLGHVDVVIGPSTDGGYCLIGLSKPGLPIFDRISWGTDRVLSETLNRIAKAKLSCHLLPFWYDVDTPAHLDLLRSHLPLLHKKGRLEAVHTYRALKNLG